MLAAGLTGPDGNFGATDLKPSGTWQAGTSGGSFGYRSAGQCSGLQAGGEGPRGSAR